MSERIKPTSVNDLVLQFARHRLEHPSTSIVRAHFFAFGGVEPTVSWLQDILAGNFVISEKALIALKHN